MARQATAGTETTAAAGTATIGQRAGQTTLGVKMVYEEIYRKASFLVLIPEVVLPVP